MHPVNFATVHPSWSETVDIITEILVFSCIGGSHHEVWGNNGIWKRHLDGFRKITVSLTISLADMGRGSAMHGLYPDRIRGNCSGDPGENRFLSISWEQTTVHDCCGFL